MRRARVATLAIVAAVAAAAGCTGDEWVRPLPHWTLEGASSRNVRLPSRFSDTPHDAEYVLSTDVDLPPEVRGRTLTLAIPYLPARTRLTVDGHALDPLDPSITDGYRTRGAQSWRLDPTLTTGSRLHLVLAVRHTWYRSAWFDTVPRLSATRNGDGLFLAVRTFNDWSAAIGAISLLVLFLVYLCAHLMDRRNEPYLWFAVQLLLAASYPASFMLGVLQPLIGRADLAVQIFAIAASGAISPFFAHAHFKLGPTPRFWRWAIATLAVGSILASDPYRGVLWISPFFAAVIVASFSYQVWIYVKLLRRPDPPLNTRTLLVAWSFLMICSFPDIVAYLGGGEYLGGAHLAGMGLAFYALAVAVALARDHSASLNQARQLADDLRRQIGERSRELAEALARVQSGPRRLAPGSILEERYRVLREVGGGGMGVVYEVERVTDGRRLALKVVTGNASGQTLARFAREAQILAQLDHPNLVAIVDIDLSRSGTLFLVMELVQGENLEKAARADDPRWALRVARQIAEGLAAMHDKGIVHRDLKPANVLVTSAGDDPHVKIADFGVASLRGADLAATPPPEAAEAATAPTASGDELGDTLDAASDRLTRPGAIMGTPLYMAPELARGAHDAGAAADMFSFGVLAFELFTGALPFPEPPFMVAMRGRSAAPAPGLATVEDALDPRLCVLIDECLAFDPADRPTARHAAALLALLDPRRAASAGSAT